MGFSIICISILSLKHKSSCDFKEVVNVFTLPCEKEKKHVFLLVRLSMQHSKTVWNELESESKSKTLISTGISLPSIPQQDLISASPSMSNPFSLWNVFCSVGSGPSREDNQRSGCSQSKGRLRPLSSLRLQAFDLAQGKSHHPIWSRYSSHSWDRAGRGRLSLALQSNSGYVNKNAQQHTQGMYYNRPQQQEGRPAQPFILSALFSVVGEELQDKFAHNSKLPLCVPSRSLSHTPTHTASHSLIHALTPHWNVGVQF